MILEHVFNSGVEGPGDAEGQRQRRGVLARLDGGRTGGPALATTPSSWWLFARLAGWSGPQAGDLNADGVVDLLDLAILSRHWLEEP